MNYSRYKNRYINIMNNYIHIFYDSDLIIDGFFYTSSYAHNNELIIWDNKTFLELKDKV